MLQLTDLTAGYGSTPVLRDVSFTLENGERAAILGRNGVGKTTLMRAISGSIEATGGTIQLAGENLTTKRAFERARLGISHVPQGRDIFPKLTVLENLKVGASAASAKTGDRLTEVLDEFPVLAEKRGARGGSLSGGQQQILALARALMSDPTVLLLDEPSEGIQPSILDEIVEVIERINAERGIAVLIVEQNLDFASRIASRGLIMNKGEIVADVRTEELAADSELQKRYMAL